MGYKESNHLMFTGLIRRKIFEKGFRRFVIRRDKYLHIRFSGQLTM